MRFERYPLDEHICKFRVGSTNMDINFMRFGDTVATFDESSKNTILDYSVKVTKLNEEDRIIQYQGQNYSVTGDYTRISHSIIFRQKNNLIVIIVQVLRCGCLGTC